METQDVTTRLETFSNISYSNIKRIDRVRLRGRLCPYMAWCRVQSIASMLYGIAQLNSSLLHINVKFTTAAFKC